MNSKGYIADHGRAVSLLQERVKVARGDRPAAMVIRNSHWLDVFTGRWQKGDVAVFDGVIVGVSETYDADVVVDGSGCYLVPGFIDAHVHIESSMMTPRQFVKAVLPKGTTSVMWDPHEIANVKGVSGIKWALEASEGLPIEFFVMVPSCVPSTSGNLQLESSGAELLAKDIEQFASHPRVLGLAEMMNWPGLVHGDPEVMAKLVAFQEKKRDGHCPGLSGKALNAYGVAGIHSCHESTTKAEAREKLSKGIHVLIREGSCAKDADELLPLLDAWSSATLGYCSDDRNPLDIEETGHLDCIINKALVAGLDPIAAFRAASFAPARIYGLDDRGAIAPGYRADMVLVKPVAGNSDFSKGITVNKVWRGGTESSLLLAAVEKSKNPVLAFADEKNLNIKSAQIKPEDFTIPATKSSQTKVRVIGVRPNQIVTDPLIRDAAIINGYIQADATKSLNKISVIERHHGSGKMATALVEGLELKSGAIATSINHDCHNVIVTGSSDDLMAKAVDELRKIDGGIVVVSSDGFCESLALPLGGLMTHEEPEVVAHKLRGLKKLAKKIGCPLEEPFLQLSFLALPVIPSLKITDRGLVDGTTFQVITVEVTN
jgi:adenine deaminase